MNWCIEFLQREAAEYRRKAEVAKRLSLPDVRKNYLRKAEQTEAYIARLAQNITLTTAQSKG